MSTITAPPRVRPGRGDNDVSDEHITVSRVLLRDVLCALRGDMDPGDEASLREQINERLASARDVDAPARGEATT
jgi:hypothetical protein